MKTTEQPRPADDLTIADIAIGIRHEDPSRPGWGRGLSVPVFLRSENVGALLRYADGTIEIRIDEARLRVLIQMFRDLLWSAERDLETAAAAALKETPPNDASAAAGPTAP